MSEAPSRRRWVLTALIVSLAVNLLVISAIAGAVLRDGPPHGRPAPELRIVGGATPLIMALPQTHRDDLIAKIRASAPDRREARQTHRARFDALLNSLAADPFLRADLERQLAEQRGAATARQAAGEALLLDQITGMTPQERSAYAERLRRSFRTGERPDRRHSDRMHKDRH